MEQRAYHGDIQPGDLAQALRAEFGGRAYRVQQLGDPDHLVVQIALPEVPASGGATSLTVHLVETDSGVHVRVGQQAWLGVAASLGMTALAALRNPFSLVGRLDDLAQDLASIQLRDRVWATLEMSAAAVGAALALSEALRGITCAYCRSANPISAPSCEACGAPLGDQRPIACTNCGFLSPAGATVCPECGESLESE